MFHVYICFLSLGPYETILPVFTNIVKGKGNVDVKCKPTGSGTCKYSSKSFSSGFT
jgi:hypothetical protein